MTRRIADVAGVARVAVAYFADVVPGNVEVLARPRAQEGGEYAAQAESAAGAGAEAGDDARMAGSG